MNISVVIPIYNEEKYIDSCIQSLLKQKYPQENMEWIFVDGGSDDHTLAILEGYQKNFPNLIRILHNPYKIVPYAMNIGIKESKGNYIIRLDAHAEYDLDYIRLCVYYLQNTDADNVGGMAITKGRGAVGTAIALMLSSKFGVGNSQFRTNGKSGYVDTVPFGAYRREVFEKWGGYDERLTRNQDNELNFRIRKNGGKIYLSNDIKFCYYCRDTIKGISDMAMKNGKWNIITMKLCPGSMGVRHFIPMLFVLSVIGAAVSPLIFPPLAYFFSVEAVAYLVLDLAFSLLAAKEARHLFLLIILFPIFHITYGIGSLFGISALISGKYR